MTIPNQAVKEARVRAKVVLFLAHGFATGRAAVAPGTFGTLPGVVLAVALLSMPLPLSVYIGITVLLLAVGIPLCGEAAVLLGRKDPPSVVWDEIVGMLVTMTAVPLSLASVLAGFVLFRMFDIWKPWPIGWVDRQIAGGLGIMLDDVIAGVMACGVLHAALALGLPLEPESQVVSLNLPIDVFLIFFCIIVAAVYPRPRNDKQNAVKDAALVSIVWASMPLAFHAYMTARHTPSWSSDLPLVLAGFIAFRLFEIWKSILAESLERRGLGKIANTLELFIIVTVGFLTVATFILLAKALITFPPQ